MEPSGQKGSDSGPSFSASTKGAPYLVLDSFRAVLDVLLNNDFAGHARGICTTASSEVA